MQFLIRTSYIPERLNYAARRRNVYLDAYGGMGPDGERNKLINAVPILFLFYGFCLNPDIGMHQNVVEL